MRQSTLGNYETDDDQPTAAALRDEIRLAVGMIDHNDRDDRLRKFELIEVLDELGERPHHEIATAKVRLLLAGVVGIDRSAYESGEPFRVDELVAIHAALDQSSSS